MGIDARIPLMAVSNPPQPYSPMETYAQMARLRAYQQDETLRQLQAQEYQMRLSDMARQRQEQDQMRAAAQNAVVPQQTKATLPDMTLPGGPTIPGNTTTVRGPSQFDTETYFSELGKTNPLAAFQQRAALQQQQMAAQASAAKLAGELNQLDDHSRKLATDSMEEIARFAGSVMSQPPEARASAYQQGIAALRQSANPITKQHMAGAPDTYDPTMDAGLQSSFYQGMSVSDQLKRISPAEGTSDQQRYIADFLKANNLPNTAANRQKAFDVYNNKTKIAPVVVRNEGLYKMRLYPVYDNQTKSTVYLDPEQYMMAQSKEPGRYTVPQYTPESIIQQGTGRAFAPGGKGSEELLAFNTALQHADLLKQAASAMKNGDQQTLNALKNKWQTEFGSPLPTNAKAIANVYAREVTKSVSGGHITDNEIKEQGGTIDVNSASLDQILGAADTYKALMRSKAQLRTQQLEQGKKGGVFGTQSGGPSGPPPGATMKVPGSDGKLHWSDGKRDLGVAE